MWSVWSKQSEVFIGATSSMLQIANAPVLVLEYPATLPLHRVLDLIGEAIKESKHGIFSLQLNVRLASHICPPIAFSVPQGIKNWSETQLLANAIASQSLNIESQNLKCEWSTSSPSAIAAVPVWWINTLMQWAGNHNIKVVSVKPLWSMASVSLSERDSEIKQLWLKKNQEQMLLGEPTTKDIDFVISKRWRMIWLLALLSLVGPFAIYLPANLQLTKTHRQDLLKIAEIKQQYPASSIESAQPLADSRLANSARLASMLQTDLNRTFALIENIKEPGIRLRNLNLDLPAETLRLDYELDTIVRTSSVTFALNAGYGYGPWKLETVNPGQQANQLSLTATSTVRATWSAELNKL